MRKLITTLFIFLLPTISMAAMTSSITGRPNAYWWSGNQYSDDAWKWAKEVENRLEGSTSYGWDSLFFAKTDTAPTATEGMIYFDDSENCPKFYNGSTWIALTSGTGDNTLDNAYDQGGAGNGRSITADTGAVAISNTDADTAFLVTLNASPSGSAALGGMEITLGANSTENGIEFENSGTGDDIQGTGDTWAVTKSGVATFVSLTSAVSASTLDATGAITLGNGTASVAVNSSGWDITSAGVVTGLTDVTITGDLFLANGKGVKASTTTAQTVGVYGYDVDNTTYVSGLLITNSDTPATVLGNASGTTAITSSDWAVSTAGAVTGLDSIAFDANAASISIATDGAADDLTIGITGATDSSVVLSSTGTGADAIKLNATAGGIDADVIAGQDINIAGGQVALVSKDNAGSAISLTTNVGTSETIVVTNTKGTAEGAITLVSTAGGVDVDAAATKDVNVAGGQVALVSKDDAASAISLTANVGTSETIVVTNTKGTSESAVTLVATAGGVNVDAAAAKDLDLAGGQVKLVSKDDAAGAISLTANIGTSETITVTNTKGTAAGAIALQSTAGGITATVATGKTVKFVGTAADTQGSNIASPAGGELTLGDGNYFLITGTNNITSIAAASAVTGRTVVLRFADVLTFTDGNNLKLAGNMSTTADDTITLICDTDGNWYETSRSVN